MRQSNNNNLLGTDGQPGTVNAPDVAGASIMITPSGWIVNFSPDGNSCPVIE